MSFPDKHDVFLTGIVPPYTLVLEIQWKEDNSESVWVNF